MLLALKYIHDSLVLILFFTILLHFTLLLESLVTFTVAALILKLYLLLFGLWLELSFNPSLLLASLITSTYVVLELYLVSILRLYSKFSSISTFLNTLLLQSSIRISFSIVSNDSRGANLLKVLILKVSLVKVLLLNKDLSNLLRDVVLLSSGVHAVLCTEVLESTIKNVYNV